MEALHMKTCPQCGELNGENSSKCFKCAHPFRSSSSYKKICPKCGAIFSSTVTICDTCHERLSVFTGHSNSDGSERTGGRCALYILSALIPLLGIILGCIYIARRDDGLGIRLIFTGIISNVLAYLLIVPLLLYWMKLIIIRRPPVKAASVFIRDIPVNPRSYPARPWASACWPRW